MEEIQNNPTNRCEEVLAHHGILGMKWGVRRYQPYPDDYTGDGKFVGKKSARAERRQARHIAKTNTRIKNAVDTGNKKKLKKYKDDMSPDEYEKKYAETVKNGIDNAVKDRDRSALKKYKEDLNKREYQHQKDRIDFKEAIDNDNSRKTKKLLSKVDPEDVTEATNLIRSRVALQDQKLSKIRQDSELMARMDKLASGLGKISKISQNVSNITGSFLDVNKRMTDFANTQKDAEKKRKEKELEKIIRSGDLKKIRDNEKRMNLSQLQEAYDRIIQSGSEAEIKKAAPYMTNKQVIAAVQKLSQMDKLTSSKKEDTPVEEAKNSPAVQVVTDWIESSQFDNMNLGGTTVGNLRDSFTRWEYQNTGSKIRPYGFKHSDDISYEDVLAHHGVLGMKWGIRRYQPYPKGYKGDGKEVGQAKRDSTYERRKKYGIKAGEKAIEIVEKRNIRKNKKLSNIEDKKSEKYLKTKAEILENERNLKKIKKSINDLKSIDFYNLSNQDKARVKTALDDFVSGRIQFFETPIKKKPYYSKGEKSLFSNEKELNKTISEYADHMIKKHHNGDERFREWYETEYEPDDLYVFYKKRKKK